MRVMLELFVPKANDVQVEFRLWEENGRKVLAIVQVEPSDRSALATALLALPELLAQLAKAGVREVGWKGFVPSGRLRPASAWCFYGELRDPDLLDARNKALEVAKSNGIALDPDPAEGRVGMLGEIDLAGLLNSDSKAVQKDQSVRSRLK